MHKSKLRVGLVLDGHELAAWAYRMIEIIKKSSYAEIYLIVLNTVPPGKPSRGIIRQSLLALQKRLVGAPGFLPDAAAKVNAASLLAGIDTASSAELQRIRASNLDVLVCLSSLPLQGGILDSARYGLWTYRSRDTAVDDSMPMGYREVMASLPTTVSELRMLGRGGDDGYVLYRSASSTDVMSLADNQSSVLWKSLHFVPRKLRELYEDGEQPFFARIKAGHAEKPPLRRLSTAELGPVLGRKLLEKSRRKLNDIFFFRQWFLLYNLGTAPSFCFENFKRIVPPKDRVWADPFVVARDGKFHVFLEELVHGSHKGHISVMVMDRNGRWEPPVRVLEAPYHLSYPFIFEFEGCLYMIPETKGSRSLELYKCTAFPYQWVFQHHLMQGCVAVDPTLVNWQGKWWLFVNQIETEGASLWDELFVYYSDSPLSTRWIPHPRNPVVSDARSARPAGRLFVRDDRLFRPSQNCSVHYGYGLNICEITTLTETEYEERVVSSVEPRWAKDVVSTHTFNHVDGLTLIDGQLHRGRYSLRVRTSFFCL